MFQNENENKSLLLVVLVLLLVGSAFIFIQHGNRIQKMELSSVGNLTEEEMINLEIKTAEQKVTNQSLSARHLRGKSNLDNSSIEDKSDEDKLFGVVLDGENRAKKINQQLAAVQKMKIENYTASPDESISMDVANERYLDEYAYEEQQAYIDAFLKNAEDAGYEVQLNDKLEVVGLRNINKEEPLRFPQSVDVAPSGTR